MGELFGLELGENVRTFAKAFGNWAEVAGEGIRNWLVRLVMARGASAGEASSCAHKVAEGVLARTDDEGPITLARLTAYIRGVAENVVREQIRLNQRRRGAFTPLDAAGEGGFEPADRGPTPSAVASWEETKSGANQAYASLDETDRELLRLAYDEKLTDREIGELLGAKGDTVRHRRLKALRELRTAMEGGRS